MMEFPNGSQSTSRYQRYIRAAHRARSDETFRLVGLAKRGTVSGFRLLVSAAAGLGRRLGRAHQRAKARRELEGLDDHMLRDLGITRDDIDNVVRNGKAPVRTEVQTTEARKREPKDAKAKVVPLHRQPGLAGALMLHGPWTRYNTSIDRYKDDAA